MHHFLLIRILLLFSFISVASSINFKLQRHRKHCYRVSGPGKFLVQFTISGEQEQNVVCTIQNEHGIMLSRFQNKAQGSQQLSLPQEYASVCFWTLDNLQKTVSLEIIALSDVASEKIGDGEFSKIYKALELLHHTSQQLYSHQHFYTDRNKVHRNRLDKLHSKLRTIYFGKAGLIIVCTLVQYFLIKKIIQRKGNGYISVANS